MPVVNAGSGRAASVRTIAETVVRAFGRDPAALAFSGQSRPGDPFSLVAAPGALDPVPARAIGEHLDAALGRRQAVEPQRRDLARGQVRPRD